MTTSNPTLLVAGGGGFVGRHVCAAARLAGYVVTTLGPEPGNDIVRDLLDTSASGPTEHGFDYLINLAAYSDHAATGGLAPEAVRRNSGQILRSLQRYGPFRLRGVHVSTSEVFGDRRGLGRALPGDPLRIESAYALGKAEQERWAAFYGLHAVRITNVWGDGQPPTKAYPRIVKAAALHGLTLADHTGGAPVQWSWVEDVAQRLVELLTVPDLGQVEHLAPDRAETFTGFVEATAARLGLPVPPIEARTPLAPVLGIEPTLTLDGVVI